MTDLGSILPTSNVTGLGMGPGWSGGLEGKRDPTKGETLKSSER